MQEEKVQRLSEGYDFIEESTAFCNESLDFKDTEEIVISESSTGEKSPYKILGKACGVFAPIGEFSRNKRLYAENLWPTVLTNEEFKTRLDRRGIFGCISHEDKKVDDKDVREGKVSHIVSKLEVREDVNGKPFLYGELDILDTPAGRILEAMYKGGANLYVSSRGAGKLVPVPGQDYSMVLPESYYVNCFDVVMNPGFLKAKPVFEQVKESTNESIKEEKISEYANFEKVRDCDTKIHDVERQKAAMRDELLSYDGKKADDRYDKLHKEIQTADSVLKGLYKAREAAANESEVETLKAQVEQLAKIVEKVVDDTYEVPQKKSPEELSEALTGFFELMTQTNVSEDTMKDILEIIFNKEGK